MTPKQRSKRILERIPGFVLGDPDQSLGGLTTATVFGAYHNDRLGGPEVVFTERGLIRLGDQPRTIEYTDIRSVVGQRDKDGRSGLELVFKSGETVQLVITGGEGRFRDVFEIQRFLMRVVEDLDRP